MKNYKKYALIALRGRGLKNIFEANTKATTAT